MRRTRHGNHDVVRVWVQLRGVRLGESMKLALQLISNFRQLVLAFFELAMLDLQLDVFALVGHTQLKELVGQLPDRRILPTKFLRLLPQLSILLSKLLRLAPQQCLQLFVRSLHHARQRSVSAVHTQLESPQF